MTIDLKNTLGLDLDFFKIKHHLTNEIFALKFYLRKKFFKWFYFYLFFHIEVLKKKVEYAFFFN